MSEHATTRPAKEPLQVLGRRLGPCRAQIVPADRPHDPLAVVYLNEAGTRRPSPQRVEALDRMTEALNGLAHAVPAPTLQDEGGEAAVYAHAVRLYDWKGPSAVEAYGLSLGLTFGLCPACESNEPLLSDGSCLVCGSSTRETEED